MSSLFTTLHATLLAFVAHVPAPRRGRLRRAGDTGQATAEYALVVVGAAAVAFIFITWAVSGQGGEKIGQLLNAVVDRVAGIVA